MSASEITRVQQDLHNKVNAVLAFELKTLARTEELGQHLDFSFVISLVSEIQDMLRVFDKSSKHLASFYTMSEIAEKLTPVIVSVRNIQTFKPTMANAAAERNGLIANIRSYHHELRAILGPTLAWSAAEFVFSKKIQDYVSEQVLPTQTSLHARISQIDSSLLNFPLSIDAKIAEKVSPAVTRLEDIAKEEECELARHREMLQTESEKTKTEYDTMMTQLRLAKSEAEEILSTIRGTAAEKGVSQQAAAFALESSAHRKSSRQWLCAAIGSSVLLLMIVAASIWSIKWFASELSNPVLAAQIAISKVFIFGVVMFLVALCSKNYAASRHNYVVNKHRQNALETYEAIVKAAEGATTSDIILSRAADCIFAPQGTGYTKSDSPDQLPALIAVGAGAVKSPSHSS